MNSAKQVKGLQLFFLNLTKGNKLKSKVKYPKDTEEIINITDIIIPRDFIRSYPSFNKVIEYSMRFVENNMIDTAITVKKSSKSNKYILTDGYIRLLILKQNSISDVPVKFEK